MKFLVFTFIILGVCACFVVALSDEDEDCLPDICDR
jgi:hypothetical protein